MDPLELAFARAWHEVECSDREFADPPAIHPLEEHEPFDVSDDDIRPGDFFAALARHGVRVSLAPANAETERAAFVEHELEPRQRAPRDAADRSDFTSISAHARRFLRTQAAVDEVARRERLELWHAIDGRRAETIEALERIEADARTADTPRPQPTCGLIFDGAEYPGADNCGHDHGGRLICSEIVGTSWGGGNPEPAYCEHIDLSLARWYDRQAER